MARPVWKGAISFGMVTIPVRAFSSIQDNDISFNLLHDKCHTRLQQKRFCPHCDRSVEWGEVVRGYEHSKGKYVVVTEEDFDKLPLPSKNTIELGSFVKEDEIDPIFYEKSYYLEPEKQGLKAYALLATALEQKGLTAVAKIAFRNRERMCALRPRDGTLMLETLHYPDEIKIENRPNLPDVILADRELEMANTLIDLLEAPFEPEKFEDEYKAALLDVVEAKVEGAEVVDSPEPKPTKVTDLVAALKASVTAAQGQKKSRAAATKPKKLAEKKPAAKKAA